MAEERLVICDIDEAAGRADLILNRPEKKNALSVALLGEVIDAISALKENTAVRCIVLSGAGDCFSSGRDLYDMRDQRASAERWGDTRGQTAGVVKALREAPQITIAQVRGYCLGGGMVLMNGCDLAIAAEDAQIGMPEILRGSYGRTATPTLFHSGIPIKQAFLIQLTGRNVTGAEAARMGLVSQAVPADELADTVATLVKDIAALNPVALEHAKIAAYTEMDLPFDQALKADDAISHRLRFHTNPLADVEGYLKSQKRGDGGGS
ncbi:MAG: enoyl-CoA hydratase-related protein [Alphaproteobacteria bacterium]|nr:enoyl-CoA hydratase-related protein [Alphaproteobacteria bacterium]